MKNGAKSTIGILAHVDAGKTTLAEALLYRAGKLKKLGRVDHRDSFLDTHSLERERGITIFSKQARFELPGKSVVLMDTPGHADLSAEAERVLQILDCALLVISGTDGVQAHTETLWRLLARYSVPTILFVTKRDLPGLGQDILMDGLRRRLDGNCVDFTQRDKDWEERIALCSEDAMESALAGERPSDTLLADMIARRELFPCYFGSGLKLQGVDALLDALDRYAPCARDRGAFGARVYKIARDAKGERMTLVKITGGELRTRAQIRYHSERGEEREEKVTQIRLLSGARSETTEHVGAGEICALLGLSETWPGQGLGDVPELEGAVLEPVLCYRVLLPDGTDPMTILPKLQQLDEEDPQLHIAWNARAHSIELRLMGKIQAEVFRGLVKERYDLDLELDKGHILYKETIVDRVEGVGHYEPLRHYAEVHLLLEPLPRGSGIEIESICPEDELDRNWQRLILTHLEEKQHLGVLTGSPITDIKIALAAGRAHLKHTEGGDFRQATYRAVRQGLMQAKSILLEPTYTYTLELPAEQIGRAMSDIRAMDGSFGQPEGEGELLRLTGEAPASAMNGYQEELMSYSRGRGRLFLRPSGYREVRDPQKILEAVGYDPEADLENTPDSVFCAHGAGYTVKWDQVPRYMHLASCLRAPSCEDTSKAELRRSLSIDERELETIMEREFGPIRRPQYSAPARNGAPEVTGHASRRDYLIVDGYNLIFAGDELRKLAQERLDLARARLMDLLSSYCGYARSELVLVFDAYRTPGNTGSRTDYHNIHVAYTKEGETADAYIERLVDEVGKNYDVRVVTSDDLIRLSALRSGVLRVSSKEFLAELGQVLDRIDAILKKSGQNAHMTKLSDGKL
ncbi:MAG: TetM/TetW/TetO/TetS family tetracycline resistance ribosomal protection protein [Oscillospiraceae bacterium]|nr:TetM/TetW/TetO/TetS family tetracycline resistance ribosomal protection protein [Oscillospiraceae bacterium]